MATIAVAQLLAAVAAMHAADTVLPMRAGGSHGGMLQETIAAGPAQPKFDMSQYVGAEYTPWRATSQLWWHNYTEHRPDVVREVKAMRTALGFTAVRVFLHDLVFVDNAARLEANMADFLAILAAENMTAGFVFFDDCWNHAGANLSVTCVPRQGIHNDCWFACPQDADRTSIARFEPYVASIVKRFAKDERVAWWEIFNEPQRGSSFSMALRDAAFGWAKEQDPAAPIISCWDDNNDTEVVDTHEYSPPTDHSAALSNPVKGGIVTEAGCRWYQNTHDYGAPLSWTTWLTAIRDGTDKTAPFAPGAMLSWEVMVGHSMTRFHWGLPEGTPEPAIPWCGSLYPDGSPVSYTEAAAIRRYTTGVDDFYFLFLETPGAGQRYLTVASGKTWTGWAPTEPIPAGGALYELTLFTEAGDGAVEVTAGGHKITLSITDTPRRCTTTSYLGCFKEGKRPGFVLPTFPPNHELMTNEVCASLCKDASFNPFPNCGTERGRLCMCGTVNTTRWPVDDKLCRVPCPGNHSETCGGEPQPGGTGDALSAYAMTCAGGVVSPRLRASSPTGKTLATKNVTGRLVGQGWNLLRVLAEPGRLRVWLNPNFADITGASAPPGDLAAPPHSATPLVDVAVQGSDGAPGLSVSTTNGAWYVDYASVLPPTLYGLVRSEPNPVLSQHPTTVAS